jgi:hypothetical protein
MVPRRRNSTKSKDSPPGDGLIVSFVLTAFWKVGVTAEHDLRNRSIAENDQNKTSEKLRERISDRVSDSTPKVLFGILLEIQLVLLTLNRILVNWSAYFAISTESIGLGRQHSLKKRY